MIVKSNSYLRRPPVNIKPEQILIFDTIRYSMDICYHAYQRLRKNLYDLTFEKLELENSFPVIFSDVWLIFDNVTLFLNVTTKLLKIDITDPIFDLIRDVKHLRNSNQHLDERIEEVIRTQELPIYGSLSWHSRQRDDETNEIVTLIYSGITTNKRKVIAPVINPSGRTSSDVVNDIEYSGVVKSKNRFEIKTIIINELIDELARIIDYLDSQIEDQLKQYEPVERHNGDLIAQFWIKRQ